MARQVLATEGPPLPTAGPELGHEAPAWAAIGDQLRRSLEQLDEACDPVTTLTNADGTYTVDTTTGAITFTPAAGVSGAVTPVLYRVSDSDGTGATGFLTVSVAPIVGVPLVDTELLGVAGLLTIVMAGGALVVQRRRRLDP